MKSGEKLSPFQERLFQIIFEADTFEGKAFDVTLLVAIIVSVGLVIIESVEWIGKDYGSLLYALEWIFTLFFTLEYILRLYITRDPLKYAISFYGIIDLLAILPTYIGFVTGGQTFMVIRALRLLRVFRIFKLAQFLNESEILIQGLKRSKQKILVFLFAVLLIVTIVGSILYLVEGSTNSDQFSNIPKSIYWAIVTVTTVGYGDISPITPLGQFLAACLMIVGYAIIAVPTGIVTSELVNKEKKNRDTRTCHHCLEEGHEFDALFCKHCGKELEHE